MYVWDATRLWTAPYRMYICEGQRLRTALSSMHVLEGTSIRTAPHRMYICEGLRLRTTLSRTYIYPDTRPRTAPALPSCLFMSSLSRSFCLKLVTLRCSSATRDCNAFTPALALLASPPGSNGGGADRNIIWSVRRQCSQKQSRGVQPPANPFE